MIHVQMYRGSPIGEEEVTYVDMPYSLATWSLTIIFEHNTTLIILIHDILSDVIALILKKVSIPNHLGHEIIISNELRLRWYLGIENLVGKSSIDCSYTKQDHYTTMAPHVFEDSKVSMKPPFDDMNIVCFKYE